MRLDEFTYSLVILAFPGIITYLILKRVAPESKESVFDTFLKIFVYSVTSYLLYSALEFICSWLSENSVEETANIDLLDRESIGTREVFGATVSAIALAILLSYAQTYNWLNKVARLAHASTRSGDKDLWTYFHNLPEKDKNEGWVLARDHEKGIVYYGAIVGWSENSKGNKELIITDAQVFRETEDRNTELLYESRIVYLNKKPEHLSIEVPNLQENNEPESPEPNVEEPQTNPD